MIRFFDPARLDPLRRDVRRRFAKHPGTGWWWRTRYLLAHPQYRTLVFYRLGEAAAFAPLGAFFHWLYHASSRKTGLEILTPALGGGVIMPHWGRMILNAEAIGEDLYLFHNVTIGNDYRTGRPSIGNNVFIGAGAILIGKIIVGDNVIIAAGSMVTGDIPSNSLAAGNPAAVRRQLAPNEIQNLIGY